MPAMPRNLPMRSGFVLISMLALCSCAELSELFGPSSDKGNQHAVQKKTYDAPAFASSLSYVKLVLENDGTVKDAATDVKVVESYSALKRTKPVKVPLVVLDYKPDSLLSSKRRLVVSVGSDGQDLSAMTKVIKRLESYDATLQEVSVMSVPVNTTSQLRLSKQKPEAALVELKNRLNGWMKNATKVSSLDAARIHIALLDHFIEHKKKDAAYLCADTAKRLLAEAAQKESKVEESTELSNKLSKLEGTLRKKMPY